MVGSSVQDTIRVVLADDSPAVLDAVTDLLTSEPGVVVVGTALDGEQLLTVVQRQRPDVVVTDVHMSHGGAALVRALRALQPAPGVVCFSADATAAPDMLAAGASGFALKGEADVDLVALVTRAAATRAD